MAERWFFALWPDDGVRAALTSNLQGLVPVGARVAHPSDLHLTLAFLGLLSAETLDHVEQAADEIRCAPFELVIDRVGQFRRARVLWCGPTSTPEPLSRLVSDLWGHLATCGLSADPRPYQPHLTLARRASAPASADWSTPVHWAVREFVLAAGYGGAGPVYRVRRRWPLRPES